MPLRSRTSWVLVVLAAAQFCTLAPSVRAAFCSGKPSPAAQTNNNTIDTGAPVFVRSVANGSLYSVGSGEDRIAVVHLWGDAYSRGYAQGSLLKDNATLFINRAYDFFESQFEEAINGSVPWIPAKVAEWIARVGLDAALDLTYDLTKKHSGAYFFDEMHGLADATGVSYDKIRRVHMIGEVTKGSCSMYGAWGDATAGGKTLQMRALDWDTSGPFQDYPQVTVYHAAAATQEAMEGATARAMLSAPGASAEPVVEPPTDNEEGVSFANVGWTGWLGSITGMSSERVAISEIGVSFPDASFGNESRVGNPFTFLLRDIIQFDTSLAAGLDRITKAARTCDLILGVGDGKVDTSTGAAPFRGIQYSHSVANFFDDQTMLPRNDTWHARLKHMVYYGMDWLCPNFSVVLHRQLAAGWGALTPEWTVKHVVPIVQTGDLHIALYDLTGNAMYVANARGKGEAGPKMAYDRTFVRLDMAALFATVKPK